MEKSINIFTKCVDTIRGVYYKINVPQNVTDERGDNLQPKIIGKRLLKLRVEQFQTEVAQAVGISDSALSMYECGERVPRDSVKIKLAAYYNTTVQSIFFD